MKINERPVKCSGVGRWYSEDEFVKSGDTSNFLLEGAERITAGIRIAKQRRPA